MDVSLLGLYEYGAACVGMNAWWATPELEYALNDSKPKVVIADKSDLSS